MSETALVQQLKEKSPAAFEVLVGSYGRRLFSVAFRLLRNPAEAEEAVQEAFLKVFRSIDSFKQESSLYTWMYRIVCNESLMRMRKRKGDQIVSIEPLLPRFEKGQHTEAIADWRNLPDDQIERRQLQEFFEKCVEELPEDHRLAYVLKDLEELSEDQVCRVLRLTKPAMKNRVHRARLAIRKRVEDRFLKN